MNYYKQLKNLSDIELKKKISSKIKKLERKSKKNNPDTHNVLGYHLGENPTQYEKYMSDSGDNFDLELRCFYNGYLCKGTKMVYGLEYDMKGNAGNHGNYYYIDDDSYIYDFCKYIQDKDIENDYELFDYMLEFIRDYYGYIKQLERGDMFKLITKNKNEYFKPIKEHSISDFKGKGNAMCSEFSVMAQNLLRFFDYESYIMIGTERIGNHKPESHAFNLLTFKEIDTNKKRNVLIDFSNYINIFDINFKKIGEMPFMGYLDRLDQNLVEEMIFGDKHLVFDDYAYYILGNSMSKLAYERKRDYFIDSYIRPDKSINSINEEKDESKLLLKRRDNNGIK